MINEVQQENEMALEAADELIGLDFNLELTLPELDFGF